MALSFALSEAGHPPHEIRVTAGVDLSKVDDGFAIKGIALELEARVPGIDGAKFDAMRRRRRKDARFRRRSRTPITLSVKLD
jgi:osmotically inducible protein OsmC